MMQVSGCLHAVVGPIIRGLYEPCGHNHGKPAFKKTQRTNGHDVFLYWWDARDGPDLRGWWFGVEKGSDVVWAYASTDSRYPAHTAWPFPHNGPVDETITLSWTSATIPEQDEEARWSGNDENNAVGQVSQSTDATTASGAGEYVEWRRMLPFDDITDGAANHDTFLRLCARLGLYSDVRTPS